MPSLALAAPLPFEAPVPRLYTYPPLARDVGRGVSGPVTLAAMATAIASLAAFIIGGGLGGAIMAFFLLAWLAYGVANPPLLLAPFGWVLPWLFPAWALMTALWSMDPVTTLRNSLELVLTIYVTLMMARALTARGLIWALLGALTIALLFAHVFGQEEVIYSTKEIAMNGGFGSKNSFGMYSGLTVQVALALALDGQERPGLRLACLPVLGLGAVSLVMAHSADAQFATGGAVVILLAGALLGRLSIEQKFIWVVMSALVGFAGLTVIMLQWDGALGVALGLAGKDATLTGRIYLWQRASEIIAAHPWTGVGYQAFWRQGNLDAEGLWAYLKDMSRSGITMHNLYYETSLQTGWIGFGLVVLTVIGAGLTAVSAFLARSTSWAAAGVAMVAFFAVRTMLETEFVGPFFIGTMLMPLIYASSRDTVRAWRAAAHASQMARYGAE